MVAKIYGFMDMTMRPVNPSPRFDLIKVRFPLCLLCWSVTLPRLGSPTILVRTGCRKTAKSWSAFSGICRSRAICIYRVGAARSNRDILREQGKYCRQEVMKEKDRVASTRVSSGTGRSGERSLAGGMFTYD